MYIIFFARVGVTACLPYAFSRGTHEIQLVSSSVLFTSICQFVKYVGIKHCFRH